MLPVQNSNATEVKISSPASHILLSRDNYCYTFGVTSIKYIKSIFICVNVNKYLWKKIIDVGCPWGGELGNRERWEQNFSLCILSHFLNFKLYKLNLKPLQKS